MAAGSCCEGDVNSLYSGLWLKECLLVTIMNIRKIMKYLYKGGLTRGWGRRAPGVVSSHRWVGTLEGEQWANISEHSGHQTLACLVLPNSKNNAASRFGIRVRGEISKVHTILTHTSLLYVHRVLSSRSLGILLNTQMLCFNKSSTELIEFAKFLF